MNEMTNTNDNDPLGLDVDVIEVELYSGYWLVEAVNHGSEGEIYRATFDGPMAKERALDYALLKYGFIPIQSDETMK